MSSKKDRSWKLEMGLEEYRRRLYRDPKKTVEKKIPLNARPVFPHGKISAFCGNITSAKK